MSVRIIFNPGSGTAAAMESVRGKLAGRSDVEFREAGAPGNAKSLAAQAAGEGVRLIVAAGGDGTINEVVNGLMSIADAARRPTLAILPLGTGNDLARSLLIPDVPADAVDLLDGGETRALDVIEVVSEHGTSYCINVAAGGFTGQMNEAMTDDLKQAWGPLAYLRGAVKVIPDITHYRTRVRLDGGDLVDVAAVNVIVANGKTAGGGMMVAPTADPCDGLLDVVVVHAGTRLALAGAAARLLTGDYTNSDIVSHDKVKSVEIESDPGMWFNVDGELLTQKPVRFRILPAALAVIVGPGFPTLSTRRDDPR